MPAINTPVDYESEILAANMQLVYYVCNRFRGKRFTGGLSVDELEAIATAELLYAIRLYDAKRGVALATFAVWRMRWAILDRFRDQMTISRRALAKKRAVNRARGRLANRLLRQPTEAEIARYLNETTATLRQWRANWERIKADNALSSLASSSQGFLSLSDQRERLRTAILALENPKYLEILQRYYWNRETAEAIGARLGISANAVFSTLRTIHKRLRKLLAARHFDYDEYRNVA